MLFFPAYAFLVWYFAVRHRRRALGFAAVGLGVIGIVLVSLLHAKLRDWSGGTIRIESAQFLLYTYGVLVFGLGVFLVALPRAPRDRRLELGCCLACGYDLRGLDTELDHLCPECGAAFEPVPVAYDVAAAQANKWGDLGRTLTAIDHDHAHEPTSRSRSEARRALLDRAGRDTREAAKL